MAKPRIHTEDLILGLTFVGAALTIGVGVMNWKEKRRKRSLGIQ